MKLKLFAAFFVGVVVGLFFHTTHWIMSCGFFDTVRTAACPDLTAESHLFGTKVPEYSCNHYYYREGFTDVDEYWSFVLRPEDARAFLDSFIKRNALTAVKNSPELRSQVIPSYQDKRWRPEMWFKSPDDLSEMYLLSEQIRGFFCGYSAENNRIYLKKWEY